MNTQLTIDLKAVSHARYWYQNQDGSTRLYKPSKPFVHGIWFEAEGVARHHHDYPFESNIERARRLGCLDVWTPRCQLQFRNNHSILFVGEKAIKMWKAYNAHIFSK